MLDHYTTAPGNNAGDALLLHSSGANMMIPDGGLSVKPFAEAVFQLGDGCGKTCDVCVYMVAWVKMLFAVSGVLEVSRYTEKEKDSLSLFLAI